MQKILLCLLLSVSGWANNISVSGVSVTNQNTVDHSARINFSVRWDNSWRTSTNENNYDGAWVFVKYKKNGTMEWRHCTLKTLGSDNDNGIRTIKVAPTTSGGPTGKGAFVYRSVNGFGTADFASNQLVWDYGADNVLDSDTVEIKVFALEMVYIPTGPYWLGTGGGETNSFKAGNTSLPYWVNNSDAVAVGDSGLSFNGLGSGDSIPASFPNGYNAFWIMKYECTQQQYADFLNTLDLAKATALNTSYTSFNFDGAHPNITPKFADRALDYQRGFGDYLKKELMAMADWAALRPMSEMEFEKACRGADVPPQHGEYAWGNTDLVALTAVSNEGLPNESVNTSLNENANALISSSLGRPARVGLFARTSYSGTDIPRQKSGATYYGVMNMSDNVFEIVVYAGSAAGRNVSEEVHGLGGALTPSADTPIQEWADAELTKRGSSYRTAANFTQAQYLARVSNRGHHGGNGAISQGIRLVHTAP